MFYYLSSVCKHDTHWEQISERIGNDGFEFTSTR